MNRRRFHRSVYLGILKRQRLLCGCGCGVRLTRAEGYQYDHALALHLGGADEPSNTRAIRIPCHLGKTRKEAIGRGKVRRIKAQSGLLTKKLTKKDKYIERRRKAMPF